MSIHLGRLKKVDLREFFKDEAKDFTPWLAEEENLELLRPLVVGKLFTKI